MRITATGKRRSAFANTVKDMATCPLLGSDMFPSRTAVAIRWRSETYWSSRKGLAQQKGAVRLKRRATLDGCGFERTASSHESSSSIPMNCHRDAPSPL